MLEFWTRVETEDTSYNFQYTLGDTQGSRYWPDYHRSGGRQWTRVRLYADGLQSTQQPSPDRTEYFGVGAGFLDTPATIEVDGLRWWCRRGTGE